MDTEDRPPAPDELRELFREELLGEDGAFGLSILGHANEITRFRFYLETIEEFISKGEAEEIESLKARAATLPERRRGEFWAWCYPVHWDEVFRTNLRSAFLVSVVSFIEIHLVQACSHVEIIARTPIASSVLRGGIFEKARLFLEVFGGFNRSEPENWAVVERIYDVRNVFVHHAGLVAAYSNEKRIQQFARAQPGLHEEHGHITLGREFCPFVLEATQEFLDAIASELAALCARARRFETR